MSPSINETIDKATPYVKKSVDEATKVAAPLAKDIQTKGVPIVTVRCFECLAHLYHRGWPNKVFSFQVLLTTMQSLHLLHSPPRKQTCFIDIGS